MFLKNRNISSKIKRSKVTDYAALSLSGLLIKSFAFIEAKCFKISNTFLSDCKCNVCYQAWNYQNACQNSKQGSPDQTASSLEQSDLGLHCLSRPF